MDTKLFLGIYGELFVLDLELVMYLEADDHYTIVYYSSGTHFMLPFGLSRVEESINEKLNGESYLKRFSRKYVVNTNYIFHINVMKQIMQLYDAKGTSYSLRMPKPILRSYMDSIKKRPHETTEMASFVNSMS